jgi:hypothetical protein
MPATYSPCMCSALPTARCHTINEAVGLFGEGLLGAVLEDRGQVAVGVWNSSFTLWVARQRSRPLLEICNAGYRKHLLSLLAKLP